MTVQLLGFRAFTAGKPLLGLILGGGTKIPEITWQGKKEKKACHLYHTLSKCAQANAFKYPTLLLHKHVIGQEVSSN